MTELFGRRQVLVLVAAAALTLAAGSHPRAQTPSPIPTPDQFFGFELGTEGRLAPLDKIYEYFALVDKASDRVTIQRFGTTTMGNPMIVAVISTPDTLANLAAQQKMQRQLADPRKTPPREAERIFKEAKGIYLIETAQHSPEVTSHLAALRLIHRLATERSPWMDHILENLIVLLNPVGNPDGHRIVTEWHARNQGTPYEGSPLPELWHKYIGHDNNRDNYMQTQVETQAINRLLFEEWLPDVYVNVHNMQYDNARIFVPPYKNPANPNVDPLLWSEVNIYGQAMALKLHEAGKTGVVWGERFTGFQEGTNMRAPLFRNAIGILTETAGVPWGRTIHQQVARADAPSKADVGMSVLAPDFQSSILERRVTQMPPPTDLQARMNYPNPWRGGDWTLAEAADYQYLSTIGGMEALAYNRETRKRNFYLLNKRTIELFEKGSPYAYLIPHDQRDPVAAAKLAQLIQAGAAEVHRAEAAFTADGRTYPAGTYVALLAQPYGRWVKNLLEPQKYPDIRWPFPNSPIDRPYDVAAWSLGMLMGVETILVEKPFEAKLSLMTSDAQAAAGRVEGNGPVYVLSHEINNSIVAMIRLLKEGAEISWALDDLPVNGETYSAGAILVERAKPATLARLAQELKLDVRSANQVPARSIRIRAPRVAIFEPWGGNMDAGWTRWLFEQHELPYTHARPPDIRKGGLSSRFDVIILPEMKSNQLIRGFVGPTIRPEYRGGIEEEGIGYLREFVEGGGTLVTLGNTAQFAIERLGVPLVNVVHGLSDDEFLCPGSILEISVDNRHPIGFGMPERADAYFTYNGGYVPTAMLSSHSTAVVARYPQRPLLRSGWVVGDARIRGTAAVVETAIGKGRIIMHTFRPQHRGQTWGTFKLLFNSVYYGPAVTERPVRTSGTSFPH